MFDPDKNIPLTKLPNIGPELSKKLEQIGVMNAYDLRQMGSENALIKIATIAQNGACINMLYAIEGAIHGIRWHDLSQLRKKELLDFFNLLKLE